MRKKGNPNHNEHREPTVAPGMEMDELKEEATPEEVREGDSTPVTRLAINWQGDDVDEP